MTETNEQRAREALDRQRLSVRYNVAWLVTLLDAAEQRGREVERAALLQVIAPELRCPECGKVYEEIITEHRHIGRECTEGLHGPDIRLLVAEHAKGGGK